MKNVVLRFAPSPTGYMHLGNVRTAWINALLAASVAGDFVLRIEDTDQSRSRADYLQQMIDDLRWLGICWQLGPDMGLSEDQYQQSKRNATYQRYYQQLLDEGKAYPCFCSETTLLKMRKSQIALGRPPRYAGTCRSLSADEVQKRIKAGEKPTLRFKVDDKARIAFTDGSHGQQVFLGKDIGDFIIRRADHSASFMFCNAVDDALMKVSLVVRGEDHLSNTPRQLMICEALGLSGPQYAHMGLIVDRDNKPLSKRDNSISMASLRARGVLPLAIINYLTRSCFHALTADERLLSMEALQQWIKEQVWHEGALRSGVIAKGLTTYDQQHLMHWQKCAVMALSDQDYWQWCRDAVQQWVSEDLAVPFVQVARDNCFLWAEVADFAQRIFAERLDYGEAVPIEDLPMSWQTFLQEDIAEVPFSQWCQRCQELTGFKGKRFFQTIRWLLTATVSGPKLEAIYQLMPVAVRRQRMQQLLDYLTSQSTS